MYIMGAIQVDHHKAENQWERSKVAIIIIWKTLKIAESSNRIILWRPNQVQPS